ncbi:hypothetical protein SAMN02745962_03454 [Pseudomonas sp. LAIL14HWK12:I11]|nr:hypothetical protein SAMN02745962_03454 [Pseudomonas sp. LAIL14HWK12:I11]SMR78842.1 hypothetical protein SAMN05661028_03647 [Pseudomonas sp. LAIL14HWK12:I10]SOD04600.1 hypothetical protein SAMN05660296_03196 [Pseudomonas sp. LAIL14HWK12:I8]
MTSSLQRLGQPLICLHPIAERFDPKFERTACTAFLSFNLNTPIVQTLIVQCQERSQ